MFALENGEMGSIRKHAWLCFFAIESLSLSQKLILALKFRCHSRATKKKQSFLPPRVTTRLKTHISSNLDEH